jgi:hypothetical protein
MMRTGRLAARAGRSRSVIFGAVLGAALGLTQIAGASTGASTGASGPISEDGSAAASETGCGRPTSFSSCGDSAGSTPDATVDRSSDLAGGVERVEATTGGALEGDPGPAGEEPSPPDLQVTKSSDAGGILHEGDPITYTITISNVGGTGAEGVEVHDVLPPGMGGIGPNPTLEGDPCLVLSSVVVGGIPQATVECGPVSLEPGASASVDIDASTDGLCGRFANLVDVEAQNEPAELVGSENHAEATAAVEACHPDISLDTTASPTEGPVGAAIEFTYTVRNTGDTTLYGIRVFDEELGSPGVVDGFSLEPGAAERLTATATLGTAPLSSVATAAGEDVTGHQVSAQDSATVTVVSSGGEEAGEAGGGTPFTGAQTDGLGTLALTLTALGAALVALTGRRRRAID